MGGALAESLKRLNPEQLEAVNSLEGPVLVLAGAGSGKTLTLTLRIANLLSKGVRPENVMATTFTNKAADEMKVRLKALLSESDIDIEKMWIGTFHSLCVRLLRKHAGLIGYGPDFTIMDDEDTKDLLKSIAESLNINLSKERAAYLISRLKSGLDVPDDDKEQVLALRAEYDKRLRTMNSMDFDDILLNTLRLLREHERVRRALERRFQYIHVDEFQDVNEPQYEILKLLRRDIKNVFVVGDDDQSIYGFRNAQVRFILQFPDDFPGTKVIYLLRNYRSTKPILELANNVISLNTGRYPKRLRSARDGLRPLFFEAVDDYHEARFVARTILKLADMGVKYGDIAVLYRVNHLSRKLEEAMIAAGIPYKVYGGFSFYQRKEIKDLIAYLRLIYNPKDNLSFLRIVNVPNRGIGGSTISAILRVADEHDTYYFDVLESYMDELGLKGKRLDALIAFRELIADMSELYSSSLEQGRKGILKEMVETIINRTDYLYYIERTMTNPQDRIENLMEFLDAITEFEQRVEQSDNVNVLRDFLEWVSLVSQSDKDMNEPDPDGKVKLMTIHASKGLEFKAVFLPALEDDIIPHYRTSSRKEFEEERRLLYVAITRAKDLLFLSFARERRIGGGLRRRELTPFIEELGPEFWKLVDEVDEYSILEWLRGYRNQELEPRDKLQRQLRVEPLNDDDSMEDMGEIRSKPKGMKGATLNLFARSTHRASKRSKHVARSIKEGDRVVHEAFGTGIVLKLKGRSLKVSFSGKVKTVNFDEVSKV